MVYNLSFANQLIIDFYIIMIDDYFMVILCLYRRIYFGFSSALLFLTVYLLLHFTCLYSFLVTK